MPDSKPSSSKFQAQHAKLSIQAQISWPGAPVTPSLSLPRAPHIPPGRAQNVLQNWFLAIFLDFLPSKTSSKICLRKSIQKASKIDGFGLPKPYPNPPKIVPKGLQNRGPKKHRFFHRFLCETASVAKVPTCISYWFFQYFLPVGRFSSYRLLHAFWLRKTYQKPTQNLSKTRPER